MQNTHSSLYIRNTNPRGVKLAKPRVVVFFLWLRTCRYCVCICLSCFQRKKKKRIAEFRPEFCRFFIQELRLYFVFTLEGFFSAFSVTLQKRKTTKKSSDAKSTLGTPRRDWVAAQTKYWIRRLVSCTWSSSVGGATGATLTKHDSASVSSEFVSISFPLVTSWRWFKLNLCENQQER